MFWLLLSTSQCPAYTYVQTRTQSYIKGFTLFLQYRDRWPTASRCIEINYITGFTQSSKVKHPVYIWNLFSHPHEHRLWVLIWKQARAKSVCATNDWTLAHLKKFGECPSYSPLHCVDVQTLRIGWSIKTKYDIYMYYPLYYHWIIVSSGNSFHYCWIQGNWKFNLKINTLLRFVLYITI